MAGSRYLSGLATIVDRYRTPSVMPEISRFFGIVIRMHFLDHPSAHFHAKYGGAEAQRGYNRSDSYPAGSRPAPWPLSSSGLHSIQAELLENWRRLHADEPPIKIAPLE